MPGWLESGRKNGNRFLSSRIRGRGAQGAWPVDPESPFFPAWVQAAWQGRLTSHLAVRSGLRALLPPAPSQAAGVKLASRPPQGRGGSRLWGRPMTSFGGQRAPPSWPFKPPTGLTPGCRRDGGTRLWLTPQRESLSPPSGEQKKHSSHTYPVKASAVVVKTTGITRPARAL